MSRRTSETRALLCATVTRKPSEVSEDQANKNPGVNARYITLVHNDLNDKSGPATPSIIYAADPANDGFYVLEYLGKKPLN